MEKYENDENRSEFIRIASDMIKYINDYCKEDTDRCILTIAWDGEAEQLFAGICGDSKRIADVISTMVLQEQSFQDIILDVMKTTVAKIEDIKNKPSLL